MANSSPAKKVLLILMPLLLLAVPVLSAPNTMNIQGKLTNPSGSVLTGTFNFTFRVYDNYTSGNKLYDTNMTLATDSRGVYDIILRDVNITFADQLYLGVKVNNDAEMEPRVNLTSNPSAFRANISDDLNRNNAYTVSGVNVTGNLSLGQRLTFGLGQFFDNLANGWLKLTGALNVTSGASIGGGLNISEDLRVNNQLNITSAGNLVTAGSITSAGTIQGVTLTDGNVTITGGVVSASQVNVGGGFNAGGMTLLGADIITQGDILFSGNISVLNVTHLSVNGSILPALDSTFDIGNSSFRWRDSNFTGRIEANALTVNGSTLYVDSVNGRVGIGTASPENLFQIVSPNSNFTYLSSGGSLVAKGNAVNQPQLSLENSDADAIDLRVFQRTNTGPNIFGQSRNGLQYLTFNPNGVAVVGTGNARDLLLATNDAVRVNISSGGNVLIPSGNVGIGTTSPNDILEVIGNVRVSGSLNASSINATNMYAVSFPLGWTNLTDYPSACAPGQFMTAVGDTLGCASPAETSSAAGGWANTSTVTATALSVVIDSGTLYANATTNNVGIGTTSPSAKLHVVNPNTASNLFAFNITQQDTDAQIGEFTVNGVTTHSFSWSGTNAGNIQLSNGGVSTVFIGTNQASYFNGGNVGINTTSPAQTLTVQGTLNVSGNATGPGALFVTSSGNVGIGTTSPGAKLDVEVGTTPNGIRLLHSSGTVVAKWNVTAPGVNNDIVFGAVSNNALRFITQNTERMVITDGSSGGNVGIGTTSPGKKLEVAGTINATQLNITGRNINSSFEGDVQIKGTLYGGSPLKISGGLNVTSGTVSLPSGQIDADEIADGTIATGDIATDTILAGNIAAGAVGTSEIADGTVSTDDIATDTIAAADIAAGAVGTSEIADNVVSSTDILDGTILTGDIGTDTILAGNIAAGAVGTSEIADGTVSTDDIATDTIAAADIAAGAVGTSEIADNTVTGGDILDGTILTGDIGTDTILAGNIAAGAVGTSEIADGTVSTDDIATDTIAAADIAAGAVGTSEIADNTVTGGDILDGTILTGDIGTDTILAGNIAAGAVSDSEVSSLSWSELANYPSACTSSQTITALEDTITCTAIGNAATSTALAANGGNCAAGSYPLGIDASGASESCTTAAAHSLCTGSNAGTGLSMTATYYIGGCADGASNTESFVRGPVPARTFKNLRVYGSSDDGGLGPTVTVLKNGVATALTCIVPTGGGVCSDTTNSFTTSAGDTISLSATRLSTWVAYSIEMQP